MALSAEDKKEVLGLIAEGNTALIGSEAFTKSVGGLVTTAVGEATTGITKTLKELGDKVGAIGAPLKKEEPKGDPAADAVKAAVEAALKPINDRLAKMDQEEGSKKERSDRQTLIETSLTELKYSALVKHRLFVESLHAAGVKDKAAVEAAVKTYIAEQKTLGFEIKPTAASPEAEGAKPTEPKPEDQKTAFAEIAKGVRDRHIETEKLVKGSAGGV